MDYTKIKELIFKLIRQKCPDDFTPHWAIFENICIRFENSLIYDDIEPCDIADNTYEHFISVQIKGEKGSIKVPLSKKEYIKIKFILSEVYPI